ncbi:MAG: hypothetical protein Q9207_008515, partial [Kuettlingeria erythrocarpa]
MYFPTPATTLLLLSAAPLLSLAAVAHKGPSGIDVTVFSDTACKGLDRKASNMQFGSSMTTDFSMRSYRLSGGLAKADAMEFTRKGQDEGYEARDEKAARG